MNYYILFIVILFATEIPAPMDTTRLSDPEIGMLACVISSNHLLKLKLHFVRAMLNIPQIIFLKDDIKSMFYVYNTSGRFSRTFLGDSFAVICPDKIEMIHGILRNG